MFFRHKRKPQGTTRIMAKEHDEFSRRGFLRSGVTAGAVAATAAASMAPTEANAAGIAPAIVWHHTADVVVAGAGVSGLACCCAARDAGVSVIAVDENFDIGGRGMVSGGGVQLGGGHSLQKKYGTVDSADLVFSDWTRPNHKASRYSDRDIVRRFADENAPTFEFLLKHGVKFNGAEWPSVGASTNESRVYHTLEWPVLSQVYNPHRSRDGSGLVRYLEQSARQSGVEIMLKHSLVDIIREHPHSGRVLGISVRKVAGFDRAHRTVTLEGPVINIRARKGVCVGTGGSTGNVNYRRTFDPRLTEEYQQACAPYARQSGMAELLAMKIGGSLWATANQTSEAGAAITKTAHIGCRWGYGELVLEPDSPLFPTAKATGLTVGNWQDAIMINGSGKRFYNEMDGSYDFLAAALAYSGDPDKLNGGGPIWAIFDADAVVRESWNPAPPNVDPDFFASGSTIKELAANIKNEYQKRPIPGDVLQDTVTRYNSFVDSGEDTDFKKRKPAYKIQKPPFYAAWATPILHDSLTGIRTNTDQQAMDIFGEVIPQLYMIGESAAGFQLHGLGRALVSGRIAGIHASRQPSHT